MKRTNLGITNKSSVMVVLFISTMEVPFNAAEICEVSVAWNSVGRSTGKSNSMQYLSWSSLSGIFLAANSPDSVTNSTILEATKPEENSVCAAANVAWPQSLTYKRAKTFFVNAKLLHQALYKSYLLVCYKANHSYILISFDLKTKTTNKHKLS